MTIETIAFAAAMFALAVSSGTLAYNVHEFRLISREFKLISRDLRRGFERMDRRFERASAEHREMIEVLKSLRK